MKRFIYRGIIAVLWAASGTSAFSQSDGAGRLAGAWSASTTPRVCATGTAITNFKATYIFGPEGNFSGLSSGTGSGGRGREQLGIWKHIGDHQYRFKVKTFLFNSAGVATSYQIVSHDAELSVDGRSWSSTGISKTFTLDGIEINAGCSTIEAERVEEP